MGCDITRTAVTEREVACRRYYLVSGTSTNEESAAYCDKQLRVSPTKAQPTTGQKTPCFTGDRCTEGHGFAMVVHSVPTLISCSRREL